MVVEALAMETLRINAKEKDLNSFNWNVSCIKNTFNSSWIRPTPSGKDVVISGTETCEDGMIGADRERVKVWRPTSRGPCSHYQPLCSKRVSQFLRCWPDTTDRHGARGEAAFYYVSLIKDESSWNTHWGRGFCWKLWRFPCSLSSPRTLCYSHLPASQVPLPVSLPWHSWASLLDSNFSCKYNTSLTTIKDLVCGRCCLFSGLSCPVIKAHPVLADA